MRLAERKKKTAPTEQIEKLEKEVSQVQQEYQEAESKYGFDLLNLVVAKGYLTKLLALTEWNERQSTEYNVQVLTEPYCSSPPRLRLLNLIRHGGSLANPPHSAKEIAEVLIVPAEHFPATEPALAFLAFRTTASAGKLVRFRMKELMRLLSLQAIETEA